MCKLAVVPLGQNFSLSLLLCSFPLFLHLWFVVGHPEETRRWKGAGLRGAPAVERRRPGALIPQRCAISGMNHLQSGTTGSGSSSSRSPLLVSALQTHIYTQTCTHTHTVWRMWSRESITDKTSSLRSSHVHWVWQTQGKVKGEFNIDNSKSALGKQNKWASFHRIHEYLPPLPLSTFSLWGLLAANGGVPSHPWPQGGTALAPRVHYCPRNTSPFGSVSLFLSLFIHFSPHCPSFPRSLAFCCSRYE